MNNLTKALMEELTVEYVKVGPLQIPESVVISWVILAIVTIGSILLTRNLKVDHISKRQAVLEMAYLAGTNFFEGLLGEKGRRYVPYLMTVAIYIAFSNLIGVFGVKPPTKDLDVTAALALMSIILMFIGASPASTGGGVKTTTVAVLALTVWSVIRGDADVQLARRRVPPGLIRRALAIVSISLAMALGGTMLLTLLEGDGQPFLDMMFEAFSAMATVGVSSAGTPNLTAGSKTVLALMMFFGRVGPLTMASALASRQNRNASKIRYPEEEITIG